MRKCIIFILSLTAVLLFCYPKQMIASQNGLVIDEFRTRTLSSSTDEYIVLANYSLVDINLLNYSLIKKTSSGNNYNLVSKFPTISIAPYQKLILGYRDYTGEKDLTYTTSSLADTNNGIILFNNFGKIVDSVTYGEINFAEMEGLPLDDPMPGVSYKRINRLDTDNNFLDFIADIYVKPLDINVDKVLITELMPDPDEGDEWFEIYNPTNQSIVLDGLKICDLYGRTHCYKFPDNSMIGPRTYLTIDRSLSKITLNNDGDSLEIKDSEDNVLVSTGDSYEDAEGGASYALFGSEWKWTGTVTKGSQNVFTDIVENETKTKKTKKKATRKKTTKVTQAVKESDSSTEEETLGNNIAVKGEEMSSRPVIADVKISRQIVGIFLIILAFMVIVGYTVWDKKEKLDEIFKRFSRKHN